ncbi:hypothetical protein K2Q00_04000 [Patescibacteria group bacterium]|nr:hypothetical protein [Patescibacteria group bacterium]
MQHHAYVYEGPVSLLPKLADDAALRFDFKREQNPDVLVQQWEKFSIDEARELAQQASLKSVSGRSLFILGISSIASDAQQALLKLFEEPREGAIFVVLVPHGIVIPTLRSRFLDYPDKAFAKKTFAERSPASLQGNRGRSAELLSATETTAASEFLGSTYAKRSAWVTAFLKNDDEDTREQARVFLNNTEAVLYMGLSKASDKSKQDILDGLTDIAHFRQYLADRAPSLKMILEHFAATLPKI